MNTTHRRKARRTRETWMRVIDPERIRAARKRQEYTQRDLALLTKCSQAMISGLETGKEPGCSADLAKAICKRLDRDLQELFECHGDVAVVGTVTGSKSTSQERPRARMTSPAGSTRRKAAA